MWSTTMSSAWKLEVMQGADARLSALATTPVAADEVI
jgi:hypothetical protein